MSPFTRRSLLHAAAAVGAARALPSFAAPAATPKKAIAIVLFRGGLNALHASPLSLQGHFSTSPDSMIATGTGLMVDKSTFGALPATALTRMAVVGVDHGYTAHDPAEAAMFSAASSYPLTLAAAMSAEAALRCAIVGESPAFANFAPVPGASITTIKDVRSALEVLVGSSRAEEPPRASASVTRASPTRCAATETILVQRLIFRCWEVLAQLRKQSR